MSADIVGNGHVLGDVRSGLDRRNVVDMVWPRLENGPVSGRTEARVGLIRASDNKIVCELVPGGAFGDRQVTGV